MKRELLRKIGIAVLVILILLIAAVALFFAEGGEIYGINHDPNGPAKPLPDNGIIFEVVDEEIAPIYDGREIKSVEWWELPRKEIAIGLITSPMAYIPPITGHLITVFIASLTLAFIILSGRRTSREQPEDDNRQEIILAYITKNPGRSTQQIANATEIPRSSLRHHLRKMQQKKLISQTNYCKNPHFFPMEKPYTETERLVLAVLSREREKTALIELFNHPGSTRQELGERLNINAATANWYLKRFTAAKILNMDTEEVQNHYLLTSEAAEACQKYLGHSRAAQ